MVIHKVLSKILGDPNEKALKKLHPLVANVNEIADKYKTELTEDDIPKKTAEFKMRLEKGETVEDILPEAFAVVKVACGMLVGKTWEVRGNEFTWDIESPYDVQILGGIIIHQGNIAEMKTGEGKTLSCTMPIYLNALTGKGVHVVTVNEYLAQRDAEWMSGLYKFLGLTVGVIRHGQNHPEKQAAYACDITYGTNNEFGFDYLRDNMATRKERLVQRDLHYAIVDEVDSILIDEARTPLIISAPAQESTSKYVKYSMLIPQLEENKHYNIDEKARIATLSEEGITKMENLLGLDNIYTDAGFQEVHHIEQALKAQTVFKRDTDYVVRDGKIVIVDEFTGRLMPGRRYSEGLHQAIEAKEGVEVQRESKTLATITFQNYFRIYEKLAGMTGTAKTEEEEFLKIYGLETRIIPTNKPIARKDVNDGIYRSEIGKFKAIAKVTKEKHEKGQPVLIGTVSIERSEALSSILKQAGIPHNVLNAKQHEREAEIVANAGQKGSVTIATNMAGRGTDIKLGEGVKELGGLFVIGSERHESRRIDNQLRGRSGRQGDPGRSQFFVSMDDSLMRLFGGDRIKKIMDVMNFPEDMPIENRIISRSIESAQKRVEGHNFDIRKHVVEYDNVMNKQREIIYARRRKMLESENVKNDILLMIEKTVENLVLQHTGNRRRDEWNTKEIFETISALHKDPTEPLAHETIEQQESPEKVIDLIKEYLYKEYEEKEKSLPEPELMREVERNVNFRAIDSLWMEHIDEMSRLREEVAFQGYSQKNPLLEYQKIGYQKFQELLTNIETNTVFTLFHLRLQATEDTRPMPEPTPEKVVTNNEQIESNTEKSFQNEPKAPVVQKPQKADEPKITIRMADGPDESTMTTNVGEGAGPVGTTKKNTVGRNDPCPCGSGKKYKKCCGK